MSFLDDLLSGGPNYKIVIDLGGAALRPVDDSDQALEEFQEVYDLVRSNEGGGYQIYQLHKSSDGPHDYVDRILINIRSGR